VRGRGRREGPAPQQPRSRIAPLLERGLGVPGLFVAVYSAVGFSIYFALGVVADRGLGLTPLIFLAAGLLFVLATLSYVEGGAMFRERGGSSSFARHAFNELIAFVAGWAILIDYLIVAALAAISVPHYLEPVTPDLSGAGAQVGIATAVILAACGLNIFNVTGRGVRERLLVILALADVALQLAVIGVGALVVLHPDRLVEGIQLFSDPDLVDIAYASVIAMLAYAGIEAASDLAPDIDVRPRDLKRVVSVGALAVPLVYAGMAAIALMAVPVVASPDGPQTALGGEFVEAPVLGIVSAYEPAWVADSMRWVVAVVATPVLFWAATTAMLGVSRHIYTLAINRQIPSWLGKLGKRHETAYVAILSAGVIAAALVIPGDIEILAGIYAFGATLSIAIAHASILRLRMTRPTQPRPYRVPLDIPVGRFELPLPALVGAVATGLAWLTVLVYHDEARWVGAGWMAFGLVGYVIYRKVFERTGLTQRVEVPAEALTKQAVAVEYQDILVPIFGTELDDDIVSTAGRLADAALRPGEPQPRLRIVYVLDMPLKVPLQSPPPKERMAMANTAIERAREVASEYESVEVQETVVKAREVGAGIVQAARDMNAELIVMGAEPPTRIRGGAILGGIGGHRPPEIGPATEYVLSKAPCRVLVTAPIGEEERVPEQVGGALEALGQ
jgi:APA family basic amino acid/polyamine antiporter